MNRKLECNLISIFGFIITTIGFGLDNAFLLGVGFGIVGTSLHFRVDSLKE